MLYLPRLCEWYLADLSAARSRQEAARSIIGWLPSPLARARAHALLAEPRASIKFLPFHWAPADTPFARGQVVRELTMLDASSASAAGLLPLETEGAPDGAPPPPPMAPLLPGPDA